MKKKQATALALATLMGTSVVLNAVPVYAQETGTVLEDSITESEDNLENNTAESIEENTQEEETVPTEQEQPAGMRNEETIPVETAEPAQNKEKEASVLDDWNYEEYNGGYLLKDYKGTATDIVVPGEIDGKQVYIQGRNIHPVTHFPDDATSIELQEKNGKKIKVKDGDMSALFSGYAKLKELNVGGLDTSDVTNMDSMFSDCSSLSDITGLENWDTSSVTNMNHMFSDCSSLSDITGLENWDTSSVTNMNHMFAICRSLSDITALKDWDTSSVTDMQYMFYGCNSLSDITALKDWDTSSVTDMNYMFGDCFSLSDIIGLENWDTSSVTDMQYMFSACVSLSDITGLENWNTSSVMNMDWMFVSCESLSTISLDKWDVSNVKQFNCLFGYASGLKVANLSKWNPNVNSKEAFYTETEKPLLVIAQDEKIKNYDYKSDNRVPVKNIFNANGGAFDNGDTERSAEHPYVIEDTGDATINALIVKAKNDVGIPLKTGYTFEGWEENSLQATGDPLLDIYNRLTNTMKAKWTVNDYTIKFDKNTGDGNMADLALKYDTSANLPANAFIKDGYTFTGWNTEADGNGTAFKDEEEVKNLTSDANGEVTLYAQWVLNAFPLNQVPTINATDKVLAVGDTFNPLDGVTAFDEEDGDITLTEASIIANDVDMNNAGTYSVTYQITDSQGATAVKTITVVVNPKMEALNQIPTINATDKELTVGDTFNPLDGVTAFDEEDGDITLTEASIIANDVDMSNAGTYSITYQATDSQGATAVKTITVVVNGKHTIPDSKPENKPSNSSQNVSKSGSLPKTGDATNLGLLGLMFTGSGSMLLGLNRKKRKSQKKER